MVVGEYLNEDGTVTLAGSVCCCPMVWGLFSSEKLRKCVPIFVLLARKIKLQVHSGTINFTRIHVPVSKLVAISDLVVRMT